VHVYELSCEYTLTIQHYNAVQCFIVTAMKHSSKADLILLFHVTGNVSRDEGAGGRDTNTDSETTHSSGSSLQYGVS